MPITYRIRTRATCLTTLACLAAVPGVAADLLRKDIDARTAVVEPTAAQRQLVAELDARVEWNSFGTPHSLIRHSDFLATAVPGEDAVTAARAWVDANRALFRLASAEGLELLTDAALDGSDGHVVHFRQSFAGLPAAEGGLLTIGLVGSASAGWRVAYVSSTITGDMTLVGERTLSAAEAWRAAAANVRALLPGGRVGQPGVASADREWTVFGVEGLAQAQRVRPAAVPIPGGGVRHAWETLIVHSQGGRAVAFTHLIDAATGEVIVRRNLVHQSHPIIDVFTGQMPLTDGACDSDKGPWVVAEGEQVGSVVVAVEALLTTNDSVIHLLRDGVIVASQDTGTSPEALLYEPGDGGQGTYHVRVCDFIDDTPWLPPSDYLGQILFNEVGVGVPYPPKWEVFPATPLLGDSAFPWDFPSTDTRELWCWESSLGVPPVPLPECDGEVGNPASPAPWDFSVRTGVPTFTTIGNNARTAESWLSPLTPGPTGFMPVSLDREYAFPWTNVWHTSGCNTPFVPGQSHDIAAAVANLFAMHNRMHDWSYNLGFTEHHWNAQDSNFGIGNTAEGDPLIGDAQAGAQNGGFPSYLGRDNANMITPPDGVSPITNMYLWQPIAGAFYAPCVDGDFDMAVIGHEFGHLIENRMIGKGGGRSGHHAGAMGESFGDFGAAEILNEYDLVPVAGENPFAVGAYVTGNPHRAIRNYGMNFPRVGAFPAPGESPHVNPLTFGDMGYDMLGQQVHANGEIWSAVNFDIRQALVAKYDAAFPESDTARQRQCAEGELPADQCPGNRRWIQIVFDAMLLMPTAPSMLEARDAYLAADMMRFGGANQTELWLAFARRGFGEKAFSTNASPEGPDSDFDPTPDFSSPLHANATLTFQAVDAADPAQPVKARFYVGHYEARVSPIADTDPETSNPLASDTIADNLDDVAELVPGTYEFVANAPGYGHARFEVTLAAGTATTVTLLMPRNAASSANGASASGDGTNHEHLIDDTEATSWDVTGAEPDVGGSAITVELADGVQTFDRVQVSAMLFGQNRFTALRQFELWACNSAETSCDAADDGFSKIYTSPEDAFPGESPRPVAPELILRSFDVPQTTATHVQLRVVTNQCTGNPAFQGEQDQDPLNGTDCRDGSPGADEVEIFGDLPQVLAPRHDEVHVAALQVFLGRTIVVIDGDEVELAIEPPSLDLGVVEVGSTSPSQAASLMNLGSAAATGLTFSGPGGAFEADTDDCGEVLAAGASCTIVVTFTPDETGPAAATLMVASDEGASAGLDLAGHGVAAGAGVAPVALAVDAEPEPDLSDGNSVFEPGETVEVAPAWRNDDIAADSLSGTASSFTGPDGANYTVAADAADYGFLEPAATASCSETGVCYRMGVDDPALRPATHWDSTFDETLTDGTTKTWVLHIGGSFLDIPRTNPFYPFVETILHGRVTAGCTPAEYCPAASNTRAQMAVFLLRSLEGADFVAPACTPGEEIFGDVPASSPFCGWIEELSEREVTAGCGGGNYCPGDPVTRAQMAVFLLRTLEGSGYAPPPCTGKFADVACPSPFAAWIEDLFDREITGGCGTEPLAYCPEQPVTRGQMAVFLTRTFGLTLYGP